MFLVYIEVFIFYWHCVQMSDFLLVTNTGPKVPIEYVGVKVEFGNN